MKVLFDNGRPRPIARSLHDAEVTFAREIGWHELRNGELIRRAEEAGTDVLLTTDKNIRYQQNISNRRTALVVLGKSQWPPVRPHLDKLSEAVRGRTTGSSIEVQIPFKDKAAWIR